MRYFSGRLKEKDATTILIRQVVVVAKPLFWLLLITYLPLAPALRARSTTYIPLLMELRWFKSVHVNSGLISLQGATVARTRRVLLFPRSMPIQLHSATEQPPPPSISCNFQNFRHSHHYSKGFYHRTNIWRYGAIVHGFSHQCDILTLRIPRLHHHQVVHHLFPSMIQ
jgi:hypothetical protein